MQWTDEGIVLGVRRHGEASAILELMTREHGRHLGLVRGGAGSRLRPILQPGNRVSATWRARLDEHLGNYTVEGLDLPAASFLGAAACGLRCHAVGRALPPAARARSASRDSCRARARAVPPRRMRGAPVRRSCASSCMLLRELGFGLDLARCAATGVTAELSYVSPRSGRAVSRGAGEPWQDKLLRLPSFLGDPACEPTADDLADGFAVTGFFLLRHVFEPRRLALPDARGSFISAVLGIYRDTRVAS